MNILLSIPLGQYRVSPWWKFWGRGGWITVEQIKTGRNILWTSGKDNHSVLGPPATSFDIDEEGIMTACFVSVISMWLVWSYNKGFESERQIALSELQWIEKQLERHLKIA